MVRSAEFYQIFGRVRHEELLEEARCLRAHRLAAGDSGSRLVAAMTALRGRLAAILGIEKQSSSPAWMGRPITGKPVHG